MKYDHQIPAIKLRPRFFICWITLPADLKKKTWDLKKIRDPVIHFLRVNNDVLKKLTHRYLSQAVNRKPF